MKAVTIREAKAHLNELVQAASRGEQVVLMRGSKHVAAIVSLTADELELPSRLSDLQAERFWRWLAAERGGEPKHFFESAEEAVGFLSGRRRRRSGKGLAPAARGGRRRRA